MRHSPAAAKELVTPSPRAKGTRMLALVVFPVLVVAVTALIERRAVVVLLLEAGQHIPEGSSVVHVVERSHDDN